MHRLCLGFVLHYQTYILQKLDLILVGRALSIINNTFPVFWLVQHRSSTLRARLASFLISIVADNLLVLLHFYLWAVP